MKFILCQPAIKRFEWELEVCLTRLKKLGIHEIVLLFSRQDDRVPRYMQEKYSVEVHVYEDQRKDRSYIPSIKPYLWMKYLQEDPSRQRGTYFYLDSDVLLREISNIQPTEHSWIASACESYLSVRYIDSKGNDLMERMCNRIGIDPELIREKQPIGGAQWIIKNPSVQYWSKVYTDSVMLFQFLDSVEQEYREKHKPSYTPIQKWTAEMWAQLWNVYHFGINVETPESMNFCWPTDAVEKYHHTNIYHNAGVIDDNQALFFKGKYINKTPIGENFDYVDSEKASIEYVHAIQEVAEEEMKMAKKAKYEVIESFRDLEEDKEYFEGDRFPKPANKKVSEERLNELSSSNNKAGRPLIKKIEDSK